MVDAPEDKSVVGSFPALPQPVTSFGGAVIEEDLYLYGGHTSEAHSYSSAEQSNQLLRLNLSQSDAWKIVSTGPRLQGLALVAFDGKLFRVGGFTAKNVKGEKHDLWSQTGVACFDPKRGEWSDLPPLPEARSSHDAAIIDGRIYVVGGWCLAGAEETKWHDSACAIDLKDETPHWQSLAPPPFQRRALAVAAHAGKLYVVGGMTTDGDSSSRVDLYDPATDEWSQVPSLEGEPREGFGCSAFATGGRLYVSTAGGKLQRLSTDGRSWEIAQQLDTARFFHRMLPMDEHRLVIVGGANMSSGKFVKLEIVDVG